MSVLNSHKRSFCASNSIALTLFINVRLKRSAAPCKHKHWLRAFVMLTTLETTLDTRRSTTRFVLKLSEGGPASGNQQ